MLSSCTLWSSSLRLFSRLRRGGADPGRLESLGHRHGECRALRHLSLLDVVEAHLLHRFLFLEGVSSLRQSQFPHYYHLFGVIVAAAVLRWGGGAVVLAASTCYILLASLSYVQPLTTVLADAYEPGGGVFPQVFQQFSFGQRHLHGVAASAIGLALCMVAPRLISAS